MHAGGHETVEVVNAEGRSPFVLVCDHAARTLPAAYGDMGLTEAERASHIAWDPGALEVSRRLVALLDAPLVATRVSRLVLDVNRGPDDPRLIWTLSERTRIAANENLSPAERQDRIAALHVPYHDAIDALLKARARRGQPSILICVHTFTPVFHGVARPWEIGLIHGADPRFSAALRDALAAAEPALTIGWNEPYAARDGVTYTLERHGDGGGHHTSMIEIRNDEVSSPDGTARWAGRLARCLGALEVWAGTTPTHGAGTDRVTGGLNG